MPIVLQLWEHLMMPLRCVQSMERIHQYNFLQCTVFSYIDTFISTRFCHAQPCHSQIHSYAQEGCYSLHVKKLAIVRSALRTLYFVPLPKRLEAQQCWRTSGVSLSSLKHSKSQQIKYKQLHAMRVFAENFSRCTFVCHGISMPVNETAIMA